MCFGNQVQTEQKTTNTTLPSYLSKTFGVPRERLGAFSVIPWIAAFIMQNASGWFADRLHQRGMPLGAVRKLMQDSAFAIGGLPLLVLPLARTPELAARFRAQPGDTVAWVVT